MPSSNGLPVRTLLQGSPWEGCSSSLLPGAADSAVTSGQVAQQQCSNGCCEEVMGHLRRRVDAAGPVVHRLGHELAPSAGGRSQAAVHVHDKGHESCLEPVRGGLVLDLLVSLR